MIKNKIKLPKVPKILNKEAIESIVLVSQFFNGDVKKTTAWFNIKNPMLGYIKPQDMLIMNRANKLLKVIKNLLEGNIP